MAPFVMLLLHDADMSRPLRQADFVCNLDEQSLFFLGALAD